jgi:hypothetical protein
MNIESITFLICIFLITLIILLFYFVYENKQTLRKVEENDHLSEIKMNNLIDATNYNDKILYKQQQYIHSIYNSNNSYDIIDNNEDGVMTIENKQHHTDDPLYYDMMKNYDALTSISK